MIYPCSLYAHTASYIECYRRPWRAPGRMDGRAPLFGSQGHACHFNQFVFSFICVTSILTYSPWYRSHYRGIPLRKHNSTDLERAARLEQCVYVHEQHHVRRAVCRLSGTVPDQGSWHRQRHCRFCQPRVRYHGEHACRGPLCLRLIVSFRLQSSPCTLIWRPLYRYTSPAPCFLCLGSLRSCCHLNLEERHLSRCWRL